MKLFDRIYLKNFIFSVILPLSLVFAACPAKAGQSLDQMVAVVNQDVITQSQLDQAMQRIKQEMPQNGGAPQLPPDSELRKVVLNQLIDRSLQLQMAKRLNYTATPAQVDKAINEIVARNHINLDRLKQQLQLEGYSFTQFREEIRKQILVNQVQQAALGAGVAITKNEIKQFMKQAQSSVNRSYHVIDFLLPLADNQKSTVENATNQAHQIMEALQQKTSSQQITAKYPSLQMNDLNWQPLAALPDLFIKKLSTMQEGNTAGPIKAPNGIHIIQLVGVRTDGSQPAITVQQAQQILYQQKVQKSLQKWLATIRKTAYVKIC